MAAREELSQKGFAVTYFDVRQDPAKLREMLQLNGGEREVPTLVEDGRVRIGYGGT